MGEETCHLGLLPVFLLTCAIMAVAKDWPTLLLGFVLFGLYKGTSEGVFKAFVTDVSPSELRATALGGYYTIMGLVMLPGGVTVGLLWDQVGPWAAFAFGIATSLSASSLLLLSPVLRPASCR